MSWFRQRIFVFYSSSFVDIKSIQKFKKQISKRDIVLTINQSPKGNVVEELK